MLNLNPNQALTAEEGIITIMAMGITTRTARSHLFLSARKFTVLPIRTHK
ncbi:hypothetical protein NMYAN_30210 [Nitrosomonas nitrosa]|uniref:Uncharacterized protein n=1 Tax=Nitrosomonas nitrosa TaxID=52442 RepID=A0A8H8Z1A1_9PROT|nr:hypothetical protein NMYAN_30210 [Nitrosomonas nitrosa]